MPRRKVKRPEVVLLEEGCEYKLKRMGVQMAELRRDFNMLEARIASYQQAMIDSKQKVKDYSPKGPNCCDA